jgi:putative alpha-1,2-mannosidase
MDGAKIDVKMSATPNTQRGTAEEDLPYSFSKEMATKK